MKISKRIVIALGFLVLMTFNVAIAFALDYADYTGSISALSSGYAITRWPTGSGDVFVGIPVDVRAVTTDLSAESVRFLWKRPDGTIARDILKSLNNEGNKYSGADVIEAWDSFTLDMPDEDGNSWGVQAIFLYDENGNPGGPTHEEFLSIKAISYHAAIPEVPYGTVATLLTMLGALLVIYLKK